MKFRSKPIAVYIAFIFAAFTCNAQMYRSCTGTLEYEQSKDTAADARVLNTFMIYNLGTGEFVFKMDLSSVVTGKRKLDSLFNGLNDQILLFKGNYVGQAFELVSGSNDKKERTFSGILSLNANSQNCTIRVQSVNYSEKTDSKNLKLDITFEADPAKLNIPVLKDLTKNSVEIEVNGGFVNILN